MRSLIRNLKPFYYASYKEKVAIEDEYGNQTGEYEIVYDSPVKMYGNISAAQGEMQTRQFGESESYDKVIILSNPNTPIDEYSILWVDCVPKLLKDGTVELDVEGFEKTPHDYVVKKIARSLNSVAIAISKVNVNG